MHPSEFLKFHRECIEKMHAITQSKGHDYSGTENSFDNLQMVERIGLCSTEIGFLTRMTDKVSRIANFVKQGSLKVQDEKIEDTLLDLANYCILLAGYIRWKNGKSNSVQD